MTMRLCFWECKRYSANVLPERDLVGLQLIFEAGQTLIQSSIFFPHWGSGVAHLEKSSLQFQVVFLVLKLRNQGKFRRLWYPSM